MLSRRRMMMPPEERWDYILYPADGSEVGYIAAMQLSVPIGTTVILEWKGSTGLVADFRNSAPATGIIGASNGTRAIIKTTSGGTTGIANTWNTAEGTTGGTFGFYGCYIRVKIE